MKQRGIADKAIVQIKWNHKTKQNQKVGKRKPGGKRFEARRGGCKTLACRKDQRRQGAVEKGQEEARIWEPNQGWTNLSGRQRILVWWAWLKMGF